MKDNVLLKRQGFLLKEFFCIILVSELYSIRFRSEVCGASGDLLAAAYFVWSFLLENCSSSKDNEEKRPKRDQFKTFPLIWQFHGLVWNKKA